MKNQLIFIILAVLCSFNALSEPLVLHQGDGVFTTQTDFSFSKKYYDSNGNQKTSADHYLDSRTTFLFSYGLFQPLTLNLDIPVLYREVSVGSQAKDWGLGDVRMGGRYQFTRATLESAFDLQVKFPSGGTDIGTSKLPLGSGTADVLAHFLFRRSWNSSSDVTLNIGYHSRFSALVEYLQTDPIPPDNLPFGNFSIDWGDEVSTSVQSRWAIWNRFSISPSVNYLYRLPTHIHSVEVTSTTPLVLVPTTTRYPSGQYLDASLGVTYRLQDRMNLKGTINVPVWGKNYPLIPIVESLVGLRYGLELSCGF